MCVKCQRENHIFGKRRQSPPCNIMNANVPTRQWVDWIDLFVATHQFVVAIVGHIDLRVTTTTTTTTIPRLIGRRRRRRRWTMTVTISRHEGTRSDGNSCGVGVVVGAMMMVVVAMMVRRVERSYVW